VPLYLISKGAKLRKIRIYRRGILFLSHESDFKHEDTRTQRKEFERKEEFLFSNFVTS
jgi:hypothetical protein